MSAPDKTDQLAVPTSAQLRWYERSVRRYFGDDLSGRAARDDEYEVTLQVGRQPSEDGSPAAVIVRQQLIAELEKATLRLEVAVNFEFDTVAILTTEFTENFVHTTGFEYVLGLLRGAVADSLRAVGLPAALLPAMNYADIGSSPGAP